ncbi:MAG: ABC transporter substrate-binding protein [Caldilineaceae bacterium]
MLNDEEAPWYNAVELGYYADVCLEVELVPGGPGIDHLQTLACGAIDIAVSAAGSRVPSMLSSPTPADVVAVGTFLKHTPYIWLGIDSSIAQDQRSTLELTPEDFVGKKVGVQGGDDYFVEFLINKYNLPADSITIMEAGFTPDPVLMGAMDYIAAWLVNQPRLLEEQGYMNWTAFQFSDWGWDGYADISVVRRETLENDADMVTRYLAATHQGLKYLLENPEESAEIAVKYGVDAQLTAEQALRRFQLQEELVVGSDDLPIMHMTPETWDTLVASMIQYGQLELAACQ